MELGSGLTFDTRTVNGKVRAGIFFGNKPKKSVPKLPIRSTIHPDDDGSGNGGKVILQKAIIQKSEPVAKVKRVKSASSIASENSTKSKKKVGKSSTAKKPIEKTKDEKPEMEKPEINTKYVTLTQDQLTTILSLVKSNNELDITNVLENKDEKKDGNDVNQSDKSEDDESKENSGSLVKSKSETERSGSAKSVNKKSPENSQNETTKNSKDHSAKDLGEQHESIKTPAEQQSSGKRSINQHDSVKSSFFLGETTPSDGNSKQKTQMRWREELEKQRNEQRKRKEDEKTDRLRQEDEELWTKHFDTMLPTKASPRDVEPQDSLKASQSERDVKRLINEQADVRRSMDNSERSTYLRTMTSLLDPAQIEALEVKRQKQEEHRKAIEAQVAERRRQKEEESVRRRQMELDEDQRLAAERDSFMQRAEIEKARQQMQEDMREQKTKELYQQMKNAEESALRDKLARRERILRTKGHDTSRLERTHQIALEMSHKTLDKHTEKPQQTESDTDSPRPIFQSPRENWIRQENPNMEGTLVESGVQTDSSLLDFRIDSDSETDYLKLPPRKTAEKMKGHSKNIHYDKYSRTEGKQPRPKWGVGPKNQTFVPASQRYTTEQQKRDMVMRRREERKHDNASIQQDYRQKSSPERPKATEKTYTRSKSPSRKNERPTKKMIAAKMNRPSSGIHATTDNAKYRFDRHTTDSPVPQTNDFVEYFRTKDDVLDPSIPQSRPETGPTSDRKIVTNGSDPLLNPDIVRQHERQEKILREISILRQGLLLKQREVAAYPAAMNHNVQSLMGAGSAPNLILAGNLPERTNDTP